MKTKKLPYGEVNVKLFQEIKKKILEEPRRLDMGEWGQYLGKTQKWQYGSGPVQDRPPCGTVACIAGWAMATTYLKTHKTLRKWSFDWGDCNAAELLGLSKEFRDKVFYVIQWPVRFQRRYHRCITLAETAQVAADYIDWICGIEKEKK